MIELSPADEAREWLRDALRQAAIFDDADYVRAAADAALDTLTPENVSAVVRLLVFSPYRSRIVDCFREWLEVAHG